MRLDKVDRVVVVAKFTRNVVFVKYSGKYERARMGRVGAGSSCVTTTKNDLSESEIGDGDNRRSRDHQTSFFSLCFL